MANFEFKRLNINMAKYKARRDKKRKYARYSAYVLSVFVLVFLSVTTITNSKTITMTAKRFLAGLGVYTETVPNVEIQSPNYDAEGSWHINKSAKWLSGDTAEISIDVDSVIKKSNNKYKDIILVIDTSGSMVGDRIEKVKEDSKDLIDYMLSRTGNKAALVTFNYHATIESGFTADKQELSNKIDSITVGGNTNYNEPLLCVDEILTDYTFTNDKDTVVLFLTDGSPNEDTPTQVGTYAMIHDKYPNLIVSGIQYEMGNDIIYELKQISDEQYATDMNELKNVLFEAAVRPLNYEKFVVEDIIDNDSFSILSDEDIKVSKGSVTLDASGSKQKVIWNMNELYQTGGKANMTIKIKLKDSYVTTKGYYGTNVSTNVNYELEEVENTVTSTNTPVLKNYYTVIYDTNLPNGCVASNVSNEEYLIFTNVTKPLYELSCDGYLYKGYDIDDSDNYDILKINDDTFTMPDHDVHIRATWGKQSIEKNMNGSVHEKTTLYKLFEDKTIGDTKIWRHNHQDSITNNDVILGPDDITIINNWETNPYTFDESNNEWTFVGHPSKMKSSMSFNIKESGYYYIVYAVTDASDNSTYFYYNKTSSIGEKGYYSDWASNTTDSRYDFGYLTSSDTIGVYTNNFDSNTPDGEYTVSFKLYKTSGKPIYEYALGGYIHDEEEELKVIDKFNLIFADHCWQMIRTTDTGGVKIAYNGEPYNGQCGYNRPTHYGYEKSEKKTGLSSNSFYYSSDYDYNANNNSFSLSGDINEVTWGESTTDSLIGTYTCFKNDEYGNCQKVYLIESYIDNDSAYVIPIAPNKNYGTFGKIDFNRSENSGGSSLAAVGYMYNKDYHMQTVDRSTFPDDVVTYNYELIDSSDYTDIDNDTTYPYLFDNNTKLWTSTMKEHNTSASLKFKMPSDGDYYLYYKISSEKNYDKVFVYKNGNELRVDSGENEYVVQLLSISSNDVIEVKYSKDSSASRGSDSVSFAISTVEPQVVVTDERQYLFGDSFSYIDGEYHLENTYKVGKTSYIKRAYTCLNNTGVCDKVYYGLEQWSNITGNYIFYIFENGMGIEEAINDMLYDENVNKNNSVIKTGLEAWYKKFLLNRDDLIEDTIYCYSRKLSTNNFYNQSITSNVDFYDSDTNNQYVRKYKCSNETDKYSISNPKAKINYKVGLLYAAEMVSINTSNILKTVGNTPDTPFGTSYWLGTPSMVTTVRMVSSSNTYVSTSGTKPSSSTGLRPAISLKPDIEYISGDGSALHPYRIDESMNN